MGMKITADLIKTALLSYYRYKRGMVCVDEAWCFVGGETCDVLVDSETAFYDVEIKLTKSNLWHGEAKKRKHKVYKDPEAYYLKNQNYPNYFIICVPTNLYEEAVKWVEATNKNYGIIEFSEDMFQSIFITQARALSCISDTIWFRKNARKLHTNYSGKLKRVIYRRLSSAYTTNRQRGLLNAIRQQENN